MKRSLIYIAVLLSLLCHDTAFANVDKEVNIVSPNQEPRVLFGLNKIELALVKNHYLVSILTPAAFPIDDNLIFVATADKDYVKSFFKGSSLLPDSIHKEGFLICRIGKNIIVTASDPSGLLYGCLRLADEINASGKLPEHLKINEQPEMVLRGTCIGLQKPFYLPGRNVYEYPYTPETFPWFYNKQLWLQYLDSMVANRFNSLYLWNGHPFASLVRLKDYPYAVEVDDASFKKNEEIYQFITTEADRRGIWVIQMFYNIIVSKPFAEQNNLKTQDRERPIIPLIADYTRKSIAAFVEKYPNVGLMVCLGEAMEGTGNDDIEWFTKTIIPGVQDGLRALGKTEEPPIVLRAHDTDAPAVMKAAMSSYHNLYTEAKFNGEALTTYEPRGSWAALHQALSKIGTVQIENVHIMANLEPFRYAAAGFIQKSVKGMHQIMGGNGLHLYPQASYWDWPYSADSVNGRLLEFERDWLWYKEWGRYAWNTLRDEKKETMYWAGLVAGKFACSKAQGQQIMKAYEESGQIAPKLLRRFGITDGNRQTLTLGMLMNQLIDPKRFGLFTLLYESESPEGEMLTEYAKREWNHEKHIGETPIQIINEVKSHGAAAVAAINAAGLVNKNKEEFNRIKNDVYCYDALAKHYAAKASAALKVLRYKYSGDVKDLEAAVPDLEKSIAYYKQLVNLTKGTYRYANSMQTQQRKIPMRGVDGKYKTWEEVLVPFETELTVFKSRIDSIRLDAGSTKRTVYQQLKPATIKIISPLHTGYYFDKITMPFTDSVYSVKDVAPSLLSLRAVGFSMSEQQEHGTTLRFSCADSVTVLAGFFISKEKKYLPEPQLETNATANDYGQAEIKIANAVLIEGMPSVNVHAYSFGPGEHELTLGKGICLVLGFVDGHEKIPVYDASLNDPSNKNIDWLFE